MITWPDLVDDRGFVARFASVPDGSCGPIRNGSSLEARAETLQRVN
jgi:hypothetical protein